jgi:gliding motility-associated-like protein
LVTLNLIINQTPPAPQVNATVSYCQFATSLPLTASGAFPLLWYTTSAGGIGSPIAPIPFTSLSGVNNYYVSQINGNCEGPRVAITVRVNRKPALGVDKDITICYGVSLNLQSLYSTSNSISQWSFNNVTVANPTNVTFSGTYQLISTNVASCADTAIVHLSVSSPVIANAGNDDNAVYNETYQLHGSGGAQYLWTPSSVLNNASIANPIAILTDDTQFILTVSDNNGCTDKDTVIIRVLQGPTFYIPNAFTPNGDGLNDNFKPTYVGIAKLDYFRVYDRYGVLIFETSDIGKAWNGFYRSTKQNTGNFVYIVKGIDKNGKEKVLRGNVLLIH